MIDCLRQRVDRGWVEVVVYKRAALPAVRAGLLLQRAKLKQFQVISQRVLVAIGTATWVAM